MDSLNRGQAPFPAEVWKAIDEAAINAARDRLTGRRFLDLEGPFGVGLTTIEVGNDDYCRQPGPDEAGAVMGRAIPLPMLRKSFRVSIPSFEEKLENEEEVVDALISAFAKNQLEESVWSDLHQAATKSAQKADSINFSLPGTRARHLLLCLPYAHSL